MWHKPCRTFHPWCPCIKTRCLSMHPVFALYGVNSMMLNDASMHLCMMTSSNGNIFHVTGPLCGEITGPGEFPTQRPVKRSFDVFFDLRLNKPLSKQPWRWWFETPSWSLWRQCNATNVIIYLDMGLFTIGAKSLSKSMPSYCLLSTQ